jgi:Ca2+-binding RTX toxin-like protein
MQFIHRRPGAMLASRAPLTRRPRRWPRFRAMSPMPPMPYMSRRRAVAAAISATALALALAGSAQAQTPMATATSTAASGLVYVGTEGANAIEIRLASTTQLRIDDNVPIKAGSGCTAVAGDATRVQCTLFKNPSGTPKAMSIFARGGSDKVRNLSGQTMIARGEGGRDELSGSTGSDWLLGGDGDFDDLRGGAGTDTLDGGPGAHDSVSYSTRSSPTNVTLDNVANDGHADEHDNVTTTIEDIVGGTADDTLSGSSAENAIIGGPGNDVLLGFAGADTLIGGDGIDVVSSAGDLFSGPFDDGAVDQVSGGGLFGDDAPADKDICFFSTQDPDNVKFCP